MHRIQLDFSHIIRNHKNETESKFLSPEDLGRVKDKIERAHNELKAERFRKKELSFLSLPYAYHKENGETVFGDTLWKAKSVIDEKAKSIRENCTDFVQLAIGGSALGAIALYNALGSNLDFKKDRSTCKVYLPDNIDPEWIHQVIDSINSKTSFFNVISKSGGTVETLAQFFIFYKFLEKSIPAREIKKHFIIMTNPDRGPLAELCREEGFTIVPIPDSVHGRFSVLSPGGLLSTAVAGVDINELLRGARVMDQLTDELEFWKNPMMLYSAIHFLLDEFKNLDTFILMPYSQGLKTMADWYSQLIAESLGKDGKGVTPVKALGATDQHSQLQLYNDGPQNKFVTFFCVDDYRSEVIIPEAFSTCEDYRYLWSHSLNELFDAEQRATAISLYHNGVPNCSIRLPEISPYYLGQLFIFLEKVICVLGKLYKINAFDQPGVEESKEYARAFLGKKGSRYEEKRKELLFFSRSEKLRMA